MENPTTLIPPTISTSPKFRATTPSTISTTSRGLKTTSNPTSSAEAAPPGKTEEFLNYDGYEEEEEDKPNAESNDGWLMLATVLGVIFGSGVFLCCIIFLAKFFGLIALLRRLW